MTETCKQHPKTTGRRFCCEKPGTSCDAKGFAIGSFLECIVVERLQMMTSVRKTLNSTKPLISNEICLENNHKIGRFLTNCLRVKFAPKIPAKLANFSANLSQKSRGIWIFSSATYQKPCIERKHISTFPAVSSRMPDGCDMNLL